jgi:hypothetical protein
MGKNPLKRSLIVGITFLFLSTTCLPVLASEGKPDLIIEDLLIFPGHYPFEEEFRCQVKNIGNVSTPYDKDLDISITVRWKTFGLLPIIPVREFIGGTGGISLAPGETIKIPFATTYSMPVFGFYTFYCKVNPDYIIDESNIRNNLYTETVLFLFQVSIFSYKNIFFNPGSNQNEYMKLE